MQNKRFTKLYNLRIANNYTCEDMAKLLNISTSHYWQLENRKRKLYYKTALNIATIFKKKPDEIFYEEY